MAEPRNPSPLSIAIVVLGALFVAYIIYLANSGPAKYIDPYHGTIEAIESVITTGGQGIITANFNGGDEIPLRDVADVMKNSGIRTICAGPLPPEFREENGAIVYHGPKRKYNIVAICGEKICNCGKNETCCQIRIAPAE